VLQNFSDDPYPPSKAYDAGLTARFAVVMDTFRENQVDMFFDADLFICVLDGICRAIPHDSLTIEVGAEQDLHSFHDLSAWYRDRTADDRDPPIRVNLYYDGRLVAHAETEEWAMVGGPAPYHDSYTLSFYTPEDRSEQFRGICERIGIELEATITDIHHAAARKEPFTPLWKTPLKWLGLTSW
jgi:hypothetical protein